jgi:hypothetical protein
LRDNTLSDVVAAIEDLQSYLGCLQYMVESLEDTVKRLGQEVVDKLDSVEGTIMMYSG